LARSSQSSVAPTPDAPLSQDSAAPPLGPQAEIDRPLNTSTEPPPLPPAAPDRHPRRGLSAETLDILHPRRGLSTETLDIFSGMEEAPQPEKAPENPLSTEEPTVSQSATEAQALARAAATISRELRRAEAVMMGTEDYAARLTRATEEAVRPVIQGLEMASRGLLTTQEQTAAAVERLIRDASEESGRRTASLGNQMRDAETRIAKLVKDTEAASKRWEEWLKAADKQVRRMGWIPRLRDLVPIVGTAGVCSVGIVLALTWLRPGWTMTEEQREALRVGQGVTTVYLRSSAPHQAEMRRVNRWREPLSNDSTMEPPRVR
jgi:hypothetical protein